MNESRRAIARIGVRWKSELGSNDVLKTNDDEITSKPIDTVKRASFVAADIEAMLKKSAGQDITPINGSSITNNEGDRSDIAPKLRENSAVTERIQGRRVSQIMKWYTESRLDKSGGDQSSLVRVKDYFSSSEYIKAKDQTALQDFGWMAYNVVLLFALISLFLKIITGDMNKRHFHQTLEETRNELYYTYHEFTVQEEEAEIRKKLGWWFNWRNTHYGSKKEDALSIQNTSYLVREKNVFFPDSSLNYAVMKNKWFGW